MAYYRSDKLDLAESELRNSLNLKLGLQEAEKVNEVLKEIENRKRGR